MRTTSFVAMSCACLIGCGQTGDDAGSASDSRPVSAESSTSAVGEVGSINDPATGDVGKSAVPAPTQAVPAPPIDAVALTQEFLESENYTAAKKYDTQWITIRGKATFAGKQDDGFLVIMLDGATAADAEESTKIKCAFSYDHIPAVAKIKAGDTVTIRCKLTYGGILTWNGLDAYDSQIVN